MRNVHIEFWKAFVKEIIRFLRNVTKWKKT